MPAPPDLLPDPGYAFEPELTGPPPRPVPDRLDRGPYARDRRRVALLLAVLGAACVAVASAPGVERVALYVLPLAWLDWIGAGLLALAGAGYLPVALHSGPFRYVKHGLAIPARVLGVVKTPTVLHDGVPAAHAFVALVAFRHPETGTPAQAEVRSNEFSSARKDAYDTPFRVGDDVTAVYLPGALEKSLRLYPFLELSPDRHLRSASAPRAAAARQVLAALAALPALFGLLLANVYAYGRYQPIDFDHARAAVPMGLGAVILGGGTLLWLYASHRAEERRLAAAAAAAAVEGRAIELGAPFLGQGWPARVLRVVVVGGALVLGAGTAMCWAFLANAWLDRSPAREVRATVLDRTTSTHGFVFREYELAYRLEGAADVSRLLTTPGHLATFRGPRATARVRAGRLGWPWVESVAPR